MILRTMLYYDTRPWREKLQEYYLQLVDIFKGSGKFSAVAENSVRGTVPDSDAGMALQFYNFKFGNSRILQLAPYSSSSSGSVRITVLNNDAPVDEPYKAANALVTAGTLSLPSSSNSAGYAITIIINDSAFAVYQNTTQICLAHQCNHVVTGEKAVVAGGRLPSFDDAVSTARNGTSDSYLNIGFRTLRPGISLMRDADIITPCPVSVTAESATNFGFSGYLTEGLLSTTNVNNFPAHSLIQMNGVRYFLVSTSQMIPVD